MHLTVKEVLEGFQHDRVMAVEDAVAFGQEKFLAMLESYIVRFDEKYLEQQTFFKPYPQELKGMFECPKRRDY